MKKRYLALIYVLSIIICITIAVIIGMYIGKRNTLEMERLSKNNEINVQNDSVSTSSAEEKLKPVANVYMKQYYKSCGHTCIEKYGIPEKVVNMTEEEVKKYYYGWKVESFSDKELLISKENPGLCDEHFIIRDVDGMVVVYNYDCDRNENLYLSTQVLTKYLPKEDVEKLNDGINIVGKENLYELLQDYE